MQQTQPNHYYNLLWNMPQPKHNISIGNMNGRIELHNNTLCDVVELHKNNSCFFVLSFDKNVKPLPVYEAFVIPSNDRSYKTTLYFWKALYGVDIFWYTTTLRLHKCICLLQLYDSKENKSLSNQLKVYTTK